MPLGHDIGDIERAVSLEQLVGRPQVALGQHEQRIETRVVGGHQHSVDHARARLGVGERGDQDELVGIRDDDALDGVVVVCASTQRGLAWLDAHDAGQRVDGAAQVADECDAVTDHDTLAPELTCLDGVGLHVRVVRSPRHDRVAAAVDGDHEAGVRVVVAGAFLAAGSGLAALGTYADVVLVELAASGTHAARPPTSEVHMGTKSGSVLPVVATSTTSTPGTTRPRTAAAVAMRWSS